MDNLKLSVIIPVYNVEKYLPKCIDSVLNQSYKNLEIILIDDGSTDGCSNICDDYEKKDSRVRVVHKKNGGLSSARNSGLEIATGEYISFLDSDDWIDSNMYETLVTLLCEYRADVASCIIREIFPNKTTVLGNTGKIECYDRDKAIQELLYQKKIRFEVWNKVFTRRIIGDLKFKEKQICEDIFFERNIFIRMNCLVYIDKPMHNYLREREGNTNSTFKLEKIDALKELSGFIKELKESNMVKAAECIQAYSLNFIMGMYLHAIEARVPKDIKKTLMDIYKHNLIASRNNKFINKRNVMLFNISPSFYFLLLKIKAKLVNS